MINFRQSLAVMAGVLALLGIVLPLGNVGGVALSIWDDSGLMIFAIVGMLASIAIVLDRLKGLFSDVLMVVLPHAGAVSYTHLTLPTKRIV